MIIASKRMTCRLEIEGVEIVLTEHEPINIPAYLAVPLLIKFPDAVELMSSVRSGPGLSVTWMDQGAQSQTGLVLLKFTYRKESWVLVLMEDTGRFIRESDVIGVQVASVCRLAGEAAQRLGTPEADGMAADIVCTLCGIDPNDRTQ